MLFMIGKELKTYLFYMAILPPLSLYWLLSRENLGIILPLVQGLLIVGLLIIPVLANEQNEDKNRAYDFLKILPIKNIEIMAAKFGALLIAALSLVLYNCLLFSFFESDLSALAVSRSFVLLEALSGIIIAAIIYIGIFLFGYSIFMKVAATFMVLLGMVPPLLLKTMRPQMDDMLTRTVTFMENLSWFPTIFLGLLLFALLMLIASWAKKER